MSTELWLMASFLARIFHFSALSFSLLNAFSSSFLVLQNLLTNRRLPLVFWVLDSSQYSRIDLFIQAGISFKQTFIAEKATSLFAWAYRTISPADHIDSTTSAHVPSTKSVRPTSAGRGCRVKGYPCRNGTRDSPCSSE